MLGVLAALPLAEIGCGGARSSIAPPRDLPKLPPLATGSLDELLALANLRFVFLIKPREIAAVPWLIPPIAEVVSEAHFGNFAHSTGFDLRQIHEALIATYLEDGRESTLYLVRHNADATVLERLFRERLSSNEVRVVERPDLVRVSGKVGLTHQAMAVLGPDVAAFQVGGNTSRGPLRVASLYALEKLKKSPTLFAEDPLKALAKRFGPAPLRAFAVGPFTGELGRGARGLLAGATAIGGAARPSAREGIDLAIAVAGDFTTSGEPASRELASAWEDLAHGSFGHMLGLDVPVTPALVTHAPDAVAIAVELDPKKLAKGLRAETSARIDEIMR